MKIRCLIIDDEPLARERVRTLLRDEPDFDTVGEASSGPEAVASIRQLAPDLIFLDIQMPGMNGFEVLNAVRDQALPLTIFVTAFDQHAIKAFEVHALDYLLKPFKPSRFKETLERARQQLANPDTASLPKGLLDLLNQFGQPRQYLTRLVVRDSDKVVLVRADDIDYLESAGNYVVVHAGKENHVLRETLTALEEKLDPKQFLRISRSTMVKVNRIKELQPLFKGEHAVILQNGKQLTMTRGIREVQELLKFA